MKRKYYHYPETLQSYLNNKHMPEKLTKLYTQECADFCKNYITKLDTDMQTELKKAHWSYESEKEIVKFANTVTKIYNELALKLFEIIDGIDNYMAHNNDFETLMNRHEILDIELDNCYKLFPKNNVNDSMRYSELRDMETDEDLDLNYILTRTIYKEISQHLSDVFYTIRNIAAIKTPKDDKEETDIEIAQEFLGYEFYLEYEKEWALLGSRFDLWYMLLDEIDEKFQMDKHWTNRDKFSIIDYYGVLSSLPITQETLELIRAYDEKIKNFKESFWQKTE